MGKLLEKYMAEYNEALKPGIAKGDKYIIKPEIWIHSKWEEDMKLDGPWQPGYKDALRKAAAEDAEFALILIEAIDQKMNAVGMGGLPKWPIN